MMKLAGMFVELGRLRPPTPQPSILAGVASAPLPDVDAVVAYLRGGHKLIAAMDLQDDVFDPAHQILNGSSILTDGDWLWRHDYAHYVGRHDVEVPPEFLDLIRSRDYAVPELDDPTLDKCAAFAEDLVFFGPDRH
ncbi:hypothetical protein AB0C29_05155 [Actinoplanes sp. NPDC048791]|uniref:hypothetical protein n=1 Tax=Actinoplanes sp. NPDC048791 TaxID=3154623 RepID=UPI0033C8C713